VVHKFVSAGFKSHCRSVTLVSSEIPRCIQLIAVSLVWIQVAYVSVADWQLPRIKNYQGLTTYCPVRLTGAECLQWRLSSFCQFAFNAGCLLTSGVSCASAATCCNRLPVPIGNHSLMSDKKYHQSLSAHRQNNRTNEKWHTDSADSFRPVQPTWFDLKWRPKDNNTNTFEI